MSNARTALLLMDFQADIAEHSRAAGTVQVALDALAAARASGVKVIFVKVGFRDGYPEIGEETPVFSGAKAAGRFSGASSRLLEEFVPQDGEPVIDKRRFSAFAGSGLELVLRAHDIRDLVLAGVSTGGVVLSTLRHAFDMAYRMTVLSDGCFDPDAEVHDVLMRKIFPRQARVVSGAEWTAGLGSSG